MKLILAVFVLLCLISTVVSFATTTGAKIPVKKAPVAAAKSKKVEAAIVRYDWQLCPL